MLLSLLIKDFGIIEKTEIEFSSGLNVISGETGSGKSMIIEAIEVAAGGRALTDYIRAGCDKALVQAAAEIPESPGASSLLEEMGIIPEDDGTLILTREINRSGKNICRVNGQMVTLNMYRELGRLLVDIQGQYDQQLLFQPERQLHLLDEYGGEELSGAALNVAGLYRQYQEKRQALDSLRQRCAEWGRRQDVISYQINEIDSAGLKPGEDLELAAERVVLANAEKLSGLVGECYRDLYGGGHTVSSLDLTGRALKSLERASDIDERLSGPRDMVAAALYQIEEACRELSAYIDGLEFYPSRLEYVEERLDLLSGLKKKYGHAIEDILRYRGEIESELQEMEDGSHKIGLLERDLSILAEKLEESAAILTGKRKASAAALEMEISNELKDLEMAGTLFKIEFTDRGSVGEKGRERAEFFISTNPGEPLRPLSRIASGGETSRIMLAIKSILSGAEGIPTIIFDEIDTGIGGETIRSVAGKLFHLGLKRQVICVSHSPAVACMADAHLSIRKREAGGRTLSQVITLGPGERIEEIARMLGGGEKDGTAFVHARQLLDEAAALKKQPE